MNSLMLDYVSTAIVIFDDGFNCVDCNNSALEIFRFDNKTTFLKNFFRTMPPFQASGMPSVDVFKKLLRATMKNEEIRLEIVCQRADGILIPAELTLKRAYHEHKFVIIASFYNLTKIKSEYKKNVSTSEIAQLYLSSSPLAMELFNDQYRIIDCNQQALALLDFPNKNEYMKRTAPNAAEFLYHDIYTQAQDKENFFRALTDGAVRYEWVFQKRDGTKLPCEITRIRITGPDRIFVVSYIHDLSTVKAMAEELKKAESIERENRAKNQFLAQVSHVLRTPLNLISGVTEMQLQRNYSTETENSFLQIKKSSEELIRVIDNILDLSNAYSDEFFIDSKKIFTADFISEISQNINEKNFSLEADENLPQIFFGDEKRLQQIIFAFLNRAFKYDTHVTLKIFFDENSLAFNIFSAQKFQPDEMNFALTRRLVELMHGEIFVGANFFAKIPVEHEDEIIGAETAKKLQTIETKENKKFEYEPMPYGKVLVVDDVDTNLYVALQLLKPYGISAQTASSGADALQKIKNGAFFDIIFMDHMMPELDGIQTAKAIRRTGCDFPIVALTANVILGQADLFEKNGFAGFISKPIDVKQLDAYLQKYISEKYPEEATVARASKKIAAVPENEISAELAKHFMRDAKNATNVLENFISKKNFSSDELKQFTITVHGMKSALANVNIGELSKIAASLEEAGRAAETEKILAQTPHFVVDLKKIIAAFEKRLSSESENRDDIDDPALLDEQLALLVSACENYNKSAAKKALATLKAGQCSKKTLELIDELGTLLLHGELEQAAETAAGYVK